MVQRLKGPIEYALPALEGVMGSGAIVELRTSIVQCIY
jgi:hypothetical protein